MIQTLFFSCFINIRDLDKSTGVLCEELKFVIGIPLGITASLAHYYSRV
jgi:hypothetical protein